MRGWGNSTNVKGTPGVFQRRVPNLTTSPGFRPYKMDLKYAILALKSNPFFATAYNFQSGVFSTFASIFDVRTKIFEIETLNSWKVWHSTLKNARCKSTKATEIEYQENQNIAGNMESYSLSNRYLGCYSSDFSSGLLRDKPLFDVILTDPPYGIREASLKVNKDIKNSQFSLSEQFLELLNFAATHLVTVILCSTITQCMIRLLVKMVYYNLMHEAGGRVL
eukprot:sb/3469759/